MRAREFITESVDADQVLDYVKRTHAPDEFNIEYSITDHPRWALKNIPLSQLKLDPDGEERDPYNRVNWVDYDTVNELMPKIASVLKSKPIVVDAQGWIIDGNHRATAAAEAGLKSVPAYVPADLTEAFDQPYPMTWEHGEGSYDALVKLPDGTNLSIMFNQDYGDYGIDEWAVEFWRNNSQDVTGEGDAQRIFATVLSAIQHFIQEQHPERIRFSATKEDDSGNPNQSRSSLYTKLVKRYANAWGYSVDVSDYAGTVVYELTNNLNENFADGKVKGKSRPGRVKRAGASCAGSVTDLRAKARKYGGEKGKMYHWCANMKGGKKKANEEYYDGHNFYGAQIGEAIIGHLHFPNITIAVDDHAIERTQTHGVDPRAIDTVLKKLSSIADDLNQLEVNNKVWVYDPATNVALGLRRISSRDPLFKLKTVVGDRPYDGQTPIINL